MTADPRERQCRALAGILGHDRSIHSSDLQVVDHGHGSRTATGAQPENALPWHASEPLEHLQTSPTAGTHLMHRTARLRLMKRVYSDARSDDRLLTSTGLYICVTPHAVTGPHDVSRYFDEVPRGFHMREYRCTETNALFFSCGFKRVSLLLSKGPWHFGTVPLRVAMLLEALVSTWPTAMRKSKAAALLIGIYAFAGKSKPDEP